MENAIKLTDEYYLSSDGKLNLILQEKYEKREGKGRNAPLSGEFGLRDVGYFRQYRHIADYLANKEEYKYYAGDREEMEGIVEKIEKLRDEIAENLSKNVKFGD